MGRSSSSGSRAAGGTAMVAALLISASLLAMLVSRGKASPTVLEEPGVVISHRVDNRGGMDAMVRSGSGGARRLMPAELIYVSKRRVPRGPDPIHNRKAGRAARPPGRA